MSARQNIPRYPVFITCEAPLHHGAFGSDGGNAVAFRRMPLCAAPQKAGIPVLSGNAIRGKMRRILMRDLLRICGLSRESAELQDRQWDKLYAALANGGHLTSSENGSIRPAERHTLRQAVPALSVLGAAMYSYLLPGKISVGWAWPVSSETFDAGLVPTSIPRESLREAEDLITEVSLVRHIDAEWQDSAASGVTPMPVTVEALIAGTQLWLELVPLDSMSDIELGAVAFALNEMVDIGGKVGIGFGRIRVSHTLDAAPYEAWREDKDAIETARAALVEFARTAV